jgi:Uma2 family endonuclease
VEDYLALESRSEVRHELVGGRVYAMAGGTDRHDLAAFWIARRLAVAFEPRGCVVFPHNRMLRVDDVFRYPDVLVRCGRPADAQYENDARILVEVLSPDSSARDRRDKASNYVRLHSLQAYLVIDPDQPRVEVLSPEDGVWTWRVFGPGMKLDLDGWTLDVDQLYAYLAAVAG